MAKRPQPRGGTASHKAAGHAAPNSTVSKAQGPKAPVWSPPLGIPLATAPSADAVALFERAMRAMQRHRYPEAGDLFNRMLASFPAERALLDRARLYAGLCARESSRHPVAPLTTEERVTAATAALNNGEDAEAERLATTVLAEQPDHDLALYILAAAHARRGDAESALDWLVRAIEVSPDVRAQARHDVDFATLRSLDGFQQLLDGSVVRSAQSDTRRVRRARSES
jgi:tetratricopeptide (TPR) repeat protein